MTVKELLDALQGMDDNCIITLSVENDGTIYETDSIGCIYRNVGGADTLKIIGVHK